MTYLPAFKHPDFAQSTPKHPDQMELLEGDKRTPQLLYKDSETGKQYFVPNVAYNQKTVVRLGTMKFYLKMAQTRDTSLLTPWQIADHQKQIDRLKQVVADLQVIVDHLPAVQ